MVMLRPSKLTQVHRPVRGLLPGFHLFRIGDSAIRLRIEIRTQLRTRE